MNDQKNSSPEENTEMNHELSILEKLDFLQKQIDDGKYEVTLPVILIDYFDDCDMCGF